MEWYFYERKSPVSLPLSARVLGAHERQRAERENDHTHNTISNASLCFSPPKTREKTLSLSLSLEKRRRIFSVSWLLARSHANSFPYIFFHFKKKLHHTRALFCSLSHARTQRAASREIDETMVYYRFPFCAFIGASRCSCKDRGGKAFVLIFV